MASPSPIQRKAHKTHECRACGQPMLGHKRGLCHMQSSPPADITDVGLQATAYNLGTPRPIMPGTFGSQRPSEIYVEQPLINRIGPKIEELEDDGGLNRLYPDLHYRVPQARRASEPLQKTPTMLTVKSEDILPEHSISYAFIHSHGRVVSEQLSPSLQARIGGHAVPVWQREQQRGISLPSSPSSSGGSTSIPSLSDSGSERGSPLSDNHSFTFSDILRAAGAKARAVAYAVPGVIGRSEYMHDKVRRQGHHVAVLPLPEDDPIRVDRPDQGRDDVLFVFGDQEAVEHMVNPFEPLRGIAGARSISTRPDHHQPFPHTAPTIKQIQGQMQQPRQQQGFAFGRTLIQIALNVVISVAVIIYLLFYFGHAADIDEFSRPAEILLS